MENVMSTPKRIRMPSLQSVMKDAHEYERLTGKKVRVRFERNELDNYIPKKES